ncbi:hypothetical protein HER32_06770 [Hymenobacter sp. BT18]|uniref:hypothetical protein n=1 Tax=Hymenobacter sp. BT18 TaxID=2835648 RepID=UPI00143EAFE6|nr:hypothetical protein [Hymenobacter sp. BT18]QIX60896.1 hypothetical protein HER32_06770 [Hymenobacter sp. BT18]
MTKIREDATAKVVQEVGIKRIAFQGPGGWKYRTVMLLDGRELTPLECQELARRDGFGDFYELQEWFDNNHGLPFTGQLICWTDLRY